MVFMSLKKCLENINFQNAIENKTNKHYIRASNILSDFVLVDRDKQLINLSSVLNEKKIQSIALCSCVSKFTIIFYSTP